MRDEGPREETVQAKKPRRWLRRLGIAVVVLVGVLIGAYLLTHFAYPHWLRRHGADDAPRIALSLDNSLLGQIGITGLIFEEELNTGQLPTHPGTDQRDVIGADYRPDPLINSV